MSRIAEPFVCRQVRQPVDRLLGFGQVALGATLQQRLHQNAGAPNAKEGPSCLVQLVHGLAHHRNGSIAVAAPGPLPGDPQLGDRDQEGSTLAHTCRGTAPSAPARGDGRPRRPDSAARHPARTRPSPVRHQLLDRRRSAPPPRSRAPRRHRPEAPRTGSRNRRSRRRQRRRLPGRCVGPSRRRRGGPGAIRDGPATTEQCREMSTRPPAVIRYRSRRPWRGRRRPGR